MQIRLESGQLVIDLIGQDAFVVEPLADGNLFFDQAQIIIVPIFFDGKVTSIVLKQPGVGLPYNKN